MDLALCGTHRLRMAAGGALHLGAGGVGESELIWRLFRKVEIAAARRSHVCKAEWVDGRKIGNIYDVHSGGGGGGSPKADVGREVAWTLNHTYKYLKTSFMMGPFIETHEKGECVLLFLKGSG